MSVARDKYNLQRFLDAQESTYREAYAELAAGRKHSHWMWFIFPQIKGLGSSPTAQQFAISTIEEGAAYLGHPVLGKRLETCTTLVNSVRGKSIEDVFGYPDNMKFHSSMTLFAHIALSYNSETSVFKLALDQYFSGLTDEETLKRL